LPATRPGEPHATLAAILAGKGFNPPSLLQQFQVSRQGRLIEIEPLTHRGLIRLAETFEHREQRELRCFDPVSAQPLVVQLRDGRVFIAGGFQDKEVAQSSMIYDPVTNQFTRAVNLGIVKHKAGAALLSDGRVIIIGGSDNRDWNGKYSSTEIYDPVKNAFTQGPALHYPRFKLNNAVVTLHNGTIVVAGGNDHIEMLRPNDTAFSLAATMDQPYYFSTATLLPSGSILLAGGYGNDAQCMGKAWLFNPAVTITRR